MAIGLLIETSLLILVQPRAWAIPPEAEEQERKPYQAVPEQAAAGVIQAVDTTDPTAVKVTLKTPQDQSLTIVVSPNETFLWKDDEGVSLSALQAGSFARIRYELHGQTAIANTVILNPQGTPVSPPQAVKPGSPAPPRAQASGKGGPPPVSSQSPVPPQEPKPLEGD